MADPRANVRFEGIGAVYATFKIDANTITYDATQSNGSAAVGFACNLSADSTVQLVSDAALVLGKVIRVGADGFATVQVAGGMTLPAGSSVTLHIQLKVVGCLGPTSAKGYIREAAVATLGEVAVSRGVIVDVSAQASNGAVKLFLF